MARFAVTPDTLTTAAQQLMINSVPGGTPPPPGAASGTPVAGAWSDFADAAQTLYSGMHSTLEGLAGATSTAARAYQLADLTAKDGLERSG